MYISHVRLADIKGFSGARTVDLNLRRPDGSYAGWTVIAGRNGSGKTSMLRAVALAVSGPSVARGMVRDYENWISAGAAEGRATVSVVPGSGDAWPAGEDSLSEISLGLVWRNPPGDSGTRSRSRKVQPEIQKDPFTDPYASDGPWGEARGWFCAGYGPFRRLSESRGGDQPPHIARLASLFHEDATLTEGIQWLIDQHLRALENRPGAESLKSGAISVLADGLLPDQYAVDDVDSEGLWVCGLGKRFPLREMSDGYRTVTALVVDVIKRIFETFDEIPMAESSDFPMITASGVVIIDEIDAHLHISWQKRIGSWLKAHFPNIQFIVTTHSPYICQDADRGGLIRLPGPDEESDAEVVGDDLYDRVVFGSGDDAVLSELFGIETPYSENAQRLRRELVELETAVVAGTARESQIQRYQMLRAKLNSSTVARTDEVAARLKQSER